MFRTLLVAAGATCLAFPASALAQAQQEQQADHTAQEEGRRAFRVGAIGGIGFPQPLAIEPMVELQDRVALGAEYGGLPTVNVSGVETSLWSLSGDARVFPFRSGFFVGVRAGRQHIGAQTSVAIPHYGSAPETLGVDSWFVNPRVGFLWTSRHGLTMGLDAGVQIPLTSSTTSSLPLALAPSAQHAVDSFGNTWLPTVDLLRLGLLL